MLGLSLGLAFGGLGLGPEGCGCGLVGIVLASVDVKLLLLVFSLYVIIIKQTIASGHPLTSDDADNTCTPPHCLALTVLWRHVALALALVVLLILLLLT